MTLSERKKFSLLIALSLLFYGLMAFLTIKGRDIHNARLPQVITTQLSAQEYTSTVTYESGLTRDVTIRLPSVPKEAVDDGQVFLLYTVERNDMPYTYVKRVSVEIERENEAYCALKTGGISAPVTAGDYIVVSGYEGLKDGDEVFWINSTR